MKLKLLLFSLVLLINTFSSEAQLFKSENTEKVVNTLKSRIKLSGYVQGGYNCDREENSFDLKRAILMVDGQVTKNWRLYYMYEFKKGKTLEAYSEYKICEALQLRLGQYKNPFSIENQLSPTVVEQINCYSLVSNYLAGIDGSDPLYGAHGGRDQGLMLHGNLFRFDENRFHLSYQLAVMNGQGINQKDKNTQKDMIASVQYRPCREALIGASIQEGRGSAITPNPYVPSVEVGERYRRARWSIGAEVKTSLADIRTEYIAGRDADVRSDGYYATGNLHLTRKVDAVLSYDHLNRNKEIGDAASQTNYVGGLQYWFYPRCRLQLVYTYRDASKDPIARGGNLLQTQFQIRF